MQLVNGFYLPDSDNHFFDKVDSKGYYQIEKMNKALPFVKNRGVFIDIGAHCGFWSIMALDAGFKKVYAYEALPEHIECYQNNVKGNYELTQCVLGNDSFTEIVPSTDGNSGGTGRKVGDKKVTRLDDIFSDHVDLMKIDVQGMEREVLEGALMTIMRCKPLIIVEQKQEKSALRYLEGIGIS